MGGGHLMTRKGYNIGHLEQVLGAFQGAYPNLQLILEPGSAWCWQTGDLEASVVDVVTNSGITTAIIDASFVCHMPDCLEMPYQPKITQALDEVDRTKPTYRMGITFEDMNHYTTVKTNMFNGIQHPSILFKRIDGTIKILREFDYIDYKTRMS